MMRLNFRPGMASTLVTAAVFPCLLALGFWQLDRAAEKIALFENYQSKKNAPVANLLELDRNDSSRVQWQALRAEGRYHGPNILLDNRVRDGRVGYEIFTPFQVDGDLSVLIARGWVPAADDRATPDEVPVPSGDQRLHGYAGNPPWTGIALNGAAQIEPLREGLLRVQRIDINGLSNTVRRELLPFIVYLDPDADNGYDRRWPVPTSGAGKHHAYAVQWFAMAGVLLALYFKINFPSRKS